MTGNIAARCSTRWASHADGQEKARIYRAKSEIELTESSVNFQGGVLNPRNYTSTGELNHVSYNFTHLSGHGQGY